LKIQARITIWPLVGAVLATSCTAPPGTVLRLSPSQVLRFAVDREPQSLDPAMVTAELELDIAQNLFDGLLQTDDTSAMPRPDIAEAMPGVSDDGLTYTFHLRDGVSFSNGDPVTARDFVYSWSRAAASRGPAGYLFDHVVGYEALTATKPTATELSGLTAVNDRTLAVKLTRPQGSFVTRVAAVGAAVVDRNVAATPGWSTRPETAVGTGPFRLAVRAPGQRLEFRPVAHWWGEPKPALRSVQIDVVSDPAGVVDAYRRGAYDVVGYAGGGALLSGQIARLRKTSAGKDLRTVTRAGVTWLGFNFKSGQLAGTEVKGKLRTVFAEAVDRDRLAADLCAADLTCVAAKDGLLPPGLHASLTDINVLAEFRKDDARDLLKRLDPTESKTAGMQFAYEDLPQGKALAQALSRQWYDNLGVQVEPVLSPAPAALTTAHAAHPYDYPDALLSPSFHSGGTSNRSGYASPEFDRLADRADGESDGAALTDYAAAERQLIKDVAFAPLLYDARPLLVKAYVLGAGQNSFFDAHWKGIWITEH
jgi:oligopeptide transport system substrate-binding protein